MTISLQEWESLIWGPKGAQVLECLDALGELPDLHTMELAVQAHPQAMQHLQARGQTLDVGGHEVAFLSHAARHLIWLGFLTSLSTEEQKELGEIHRIRQITGTDEDITVSLVDHGHFALLGVFQRQQLRVLTQCGLLPRPESTPH